MLFFAFFFICIAAASSHFHAFFELPSTSIPHSTLPKPLAAFQYNYRPINGKQNYWLIDCMVFSVPFFSTVFKLYRGGQCTHPYFPGVLLTSTPLNILSKPLPAFPHDHCWNNWQWWERNKSCRNDYHQSSERSRRTGNLALDLLSLSSLCYRMGSTDPARDSISEPLKYLPQRHLASSLKMVP